jgi:serine/threonine protein kinase
VDEGKARSLRSERPTEPVPASGVPPKPQAADSTPPPPDVGMLGRFQLLALLGRGGMGEVYLALSRGATAFNKLVVVKRLNPANAAEPAFRQMFLDEGRLAVQLNHANVVQTFEVVEEGNTHLLVMEYLEGQPLASLLKAMAKVHKKLPAGLALNIIIQALAGLEYAHTLCDYDGTPLHIVHRDLSPHNVFITYDGVVKLVDFGIAKATNNSATTQSGMFKGKPRYMAPEQFIGSVDARADVFTLGAVLWELLAHERLTSTEDSVKAVTELFGGPPLRRLSSVTPGIDRRLDEIVARALQKDRDRRFQSAKEMREELVKFANASGQRVVADDVAQLMRELFSQKREAVRKVIQSYVRNPPPLSAVSSPGALPPLDTGHVGLSADSGPHSGSGVVPSPSAAQVPLEPTALAPRPRSVRVVLGIAAAVVLMALGGALYATVAGLQEGPVAASPSSPAAVPVPVPVATHAGETPSAAATDAPPAPRAGAASPAPPETGTGNPQSPGGLPVHPAAAAATPRKPPPSQAPIPAHAPPAAHAVAPSAPSAPAPPPAAPTAPQGRVFRTDL